VLAGVGQGVVGEGLTDGAAAAAAGVVLSLLGDGVGEVGGAELVTGALDDDAGADVVGWTAAGVLDAGRVVAVRCRLACRFGLADGWLTTFAAGTLLRRWWVVGLVCGVVRVVVGAVPPPVPLEDAGSR